MACGVVCRFVWTVTDKGFARESCLLLVVLYRIALDKGL